MSNHTCGTSSLPVHNEAAYLVAERGISLLARLDIGHSSSAAGNRCSRGYSTLLHYYSTPFVSHRSSAIHSRDVYVHVCKLPFLLLLLYSTSLSSPLFSLLSLLLHSYPHSIYLPLLLFTPMYESDHFCYSYSIPSAHPSPLRLSLLLHSLSLRFPSLPSSLLMYVSSPFSYSFTPLL